MTTPNILFEDNHIIIVNKRPSDIVQGDKTGDKPLGEMIKEYLKVKYNKPGEAFIGVVHRLDRPVSGIVVFAKTSKALTRLSTMFKEKDINKTYWAIVKNKPDKDSDYLIDYLKKNEAQNKSYVVNENTAKADKAELEYKVIGKSDNYYLLEVKLYTGRHHQIRVQLANIGSPIKGDLKYGFPRPNTDGSICLHSRKIDFVHPVSKEKIEITADPPEDKIWKQFKIR